MSRAPTRAAQMRAWIAEHGPATAAMIREAFNLTQGQFRSAFFQMVSDGRIVAHDKAAHPRSYVIGRPCLIEWGRVDPTAKRRNHERNNLRRRKGARTMAQIVADAQQKRIDAMTKKLADDNAQRRQDNADQDRRDAARSGQRSNLDALATPIQPPPIETVEEWMARTGQRPQRLTDGEVSPANRLRHDYA